MKHNPAAISRRRAIQTLFCSSAALALNLRPSAAAEKAGKGLQFLCIGDFGTGGTDQQQVAAAMQAHAKKLSLTPDGVFLLGDNFYSKDKSPTGFTTESPRWKKEIEDMYPASLFPGPTYAVLGNHDYHDNAGGQDVQLAYAKKPGVRWTMPAKWYRLDLGGLVTVLCLDSNLPAVSGSKDKKTGKPRASMTAAEAKEQLTWLEAELQKPRAPFTLVIGHHPLYSNGDHGDTKELLATWEPLFQKYQVHAYLCGHDHDLQHLEMEGKFTSHILSGGGGAKTRKLESTRKTPFGQPSHGYTQLSITPTEMRFTHFDATGTQLHSFAKKTDGSVVIG
jgi:tartrate-resistant acid phosphatase type 5